MDLTLENAPLIKLGDVVKFTFPGGHTRSGVVYGNDTTGIKCNCEDGSYFGFGVTLYGRGIKFEFLDEHPPVALYGMEYDFVSNHE